MNTEIEQLCINTIRILAMDAVQRANSGHPGMPMGTADMAYVLWTRFLKHNPANPKWWNRDRFVLSAGHGSMLLYSLLYLTGYDLPLDELKRFRQLGSHTPGHPEYGLTPGVEATTGPLGQGFAMGIGMAITERFLTAMFNKPGFPIVDHHTYAIVSDGDLMEGISHESASLAGHLGLGKLIYLYDDNSITIEGDTSLAFSENIEERFESYGWHVLKVGGYDLDDIDYAIRSAQTETRRPSLIKVCTRIAYGSPNKEGSALAHGAPLGVEEVTLTKKVLGWPSEEPFTVPGEVLTVFRQALDRGARAEEAGSKLFACYRQKYPQEAELFEAIMAGKLVPGWESYLPSFKPDDGPMPTRSASGKVLNVMASVLPNLLGGSADLAPSTNTILKEFADYTQDTPSGRNMRFGVRESAMGGILNGMALHGGVVPYGGTFLVFSDYMRPSVRLAAIMEVPVVYVWTHDSVWLGEDGSTHQPIEHLVSLRAIPNLTVIRPADANETAAAWYVALANRQGPTALILTRQNLPVLEQTAGDAAQTVGCGAYILADTDGTPDVILIATGSEVHLALQTSGKLAAEHDIQVRVVSMPSWELFEMQPKSYCDSVLPPECKTRVSIEAGVSQGWHKYVGEQGAIISIDRFGASAPAKDLTKLFGFTPEEIVARVLILMGKD